MPETLKFEDNKEFYEVPGLKQPNYTREDKIKDFPSGSENVALYKGKYNEYHYIKHDLYVKVKDFRWKRKFKKPLHKLVLNSDLLQDITYLPKELLVLYVQYSKPALMVNLSVIPKGITSMSFARTKRFPFDGVNISSLRKLKVLSAAHSAAIKLPSKLPKSIEYIDFENTEIGNGMGPGLKNFKLEDYPKLKYLNVKGSGIKKKDIPKALLDAKKQKKIKFYY